MLLALTPPSLGFLNTSAFSALLSPARPLFVAAFRGVRIREGRVSWLTPAVDGAGNELVKAVATVDDSEK